MSACVWGGGRLQPFDLPTRGTEAVTPATGARARALLCTRSFSLHAPRMRVLAVWPCVTVAQVKWPCSQGVLFFSADVDTDGGAPINNRASQQAQRLVRGDAVMARCVGRGGLCPAPRAERGHAWSCVVMCGHVWSCVVMCGHVWPCVAMCGHVWSCVVMCGHVSVCLICFSGADAFRVKMYIGGLIVPSLPVPPPPPCALPLSPTPQQLRGCSIRSVTPCPLAPAPLPVAMGETASSARACGGGGCGVCVWGGGRACTCR